MDGVGPGVVAGINGGATGTTGERIGGTAIGVAREAAAAATGGTVVVAAAAAGLGIEGMAKDGTHSLAFAFNFDDAGFVSAAGVAAGVAVVVVGAGVDGAVVAGLVSDAAGAGVDGAAIVEAAAGAAVTAAALVGVEAGPAAEEEATGASVDLGA